MRSPNLRRSLKPTSEPESEPEPAEEPAPPATEPEPTPEPEATPADPNAAPPATASGPVNLNSANYDDLRGLGLSVTQTGRVLAFREREGSFKSLDELDSIAGFPRGFLDDLKTKLSL